MTRKMKKLNKKLSKTKNNSEDNKLGELEGIKCKCINKMRKK